MRRRLLIFICAMAPTLAGVVAIAFVVNTPDRTASVTMISATLIIIILQVRSLSTMTMARRV